MRRLSNLPWPLLVPFLALCGMVVLLRFTHAEKEPSLPPLGGPRRSTLTEGQQHLLQAVESSDWRTTAELLREGADPNLRRPVVSPLGSKPDKDLQGRNTGEPLLKIAVATRDESIARLLLKHDADVNATGRFGYTPLMGAANLNEPKLVKLLLEHKADPNATGIPDKQSALHIVLSYEHHWKPAQLAPSYQTKEGQRQLENVARPVLEKRIAIIKLLLAAGADPTQKDSKGQTPTDYARKWGNEEVVKLLSAPKFARNTTQAKGAGR